MTWHRPCDDLTPPSTVTWGRLCGDPATDLHPAPPHPVDPAGQLDGGERLGVQRRVRAHVRHNRRLAGERAHGLAEQVDQLAVPGGETGGESGRSVRCGLLEEARERYAAEMLKNMHWKVIATCLGTSGLEPKFVS